MPSLDIAKSRRTKKWVLITWPAFLAACLLEALVFASVEPGAVHWFGQAEPTSATAVYTTAFFGFWLIAMASNGMVLWLDKSPRDINDTNRG